MRLAIMGPQGSGKGTQAEKIAERYHVTHLSTGEIFRRNIKEKTVLGKKAKKALDSGTLVSDEITNAMVFERLEGLKDFLLDGFPRTLRQAEELEKRYPLDHVFLLDVPEEVSLKRLTARRQCNTCGKIFGIDAPPAKKGVCDACGGRLFQRDDDTEKNIRIRLAKYHEETEPLIGFYKDRVSRLDGSKPIEDVFQEIVKVLG